MPTVKDGRPMLLNKESIQTTERGEVKCLSYRNDCYVWNAKVFVSRSRTSLESCCHFKLYNIHFFFRILLFLYETDSCCFADTKVSFWRWWRRPQIFGTMMTCNNENGCIEDLTRCVDVSAELTDFSCYWFHLCFEVCSGFKDKVK